MTMMFYLVRPITFDAFSFLMSDTVHTGVEVHKMDLEMCELVERPWLQLMYYAICLPHSCNFR